MDNYKLTYFNLRGICESIRLIFKYAGVPFEDVQVDASKWKQEKKTEFKWQMLPFLEHNGKILTQSGAIVRYLGSKFNLVPEDTWDQARCDEIFGAIFDLRCQMEPLIVASFENDTELADKLRSNLVSTSVPLFLQNLNELLEQIHLQKEEEDSSKKTALIFGGETPTWADFSLATYMEMFEKCFEVPELLEGYPRLKRQQEAVYELPGVKEWIAERPDTFI